MSSFNRTINGTNFVFNIEDSLDNINNQNNIEMWAYSWELNIGKTERQTDRHNNSFIFLKVSESVKKDFFSTSDNQKLSTNLIYPISFRACFIVFDH